jgi:hypothetical protein
MLRPQCYSPEQIRQRSLYGYSLGTMSFTVPHSRVRKHPQLLVSSYLQEGAQITFKSFLKGRLLKMLA